MAPQPSSPIRLGSAGWAIPRAVAEAFPAESSGLVRYAARFGAVEINSSFYRPHRPATYARWAEAVPDGFRFAAKVPKAITHERRLVDAGAELDRFLGEVSGLGRTLGVLLVQLPPSLVFEPAVAASFFGRMTERVADVGSGGVRVACEPRHPGWFTPEADALLRAGRIARVAADPARVPAAAEPGGWPGLRYWRLHGSPVIYRSSYDRAALERLAARLRPERASDTRSEADAAPETWCIFDNTASGAAAANALELSELLRGAG